VSPFDRRILLHINWALLAFILLLFAAGVANLYSASGFRLEEGLAVSAYYKKQLVWGCFGLCGMAACMLFDYRHLKILAWPVFWVTIALLVGTLLFGRTISGATRWIDLGLFNLQSSELAKLSILLVAARMLAPSQRPLDWGPLLAVLGVGMLPTALVVVQPDLGSGMLLLLLLGGLILFRGVRWRVLRVLLVAVPLVMPLGWFFLHGYQKQRLLTFVNPGADPQGAGYHIIQSQIAIGSGQVWGKGFLAGTQSQLRFLPEKHTDFAVAVFGEEWGFAGMLVLLIVFCLFLYQIFLTAQEAKDRFGSFLAAGVFFYFFWQILINMGMVLGLMPVVGIPLPFISYGGSATLVNFCLLGLVMNVSMRRFMFKQS
jgi:rod shape determining protein RodA